MKTRASLSEDELVRIAEDALERSDTMRVAMLKNLETRMAGRETALRRERARRVAKFGADSPKTKVIEALLAENAEMQQDVAAAALAADFKQPEANPKAGILHGRVIDESRNPIASARVEAIDLEGAVVASGETDARGYYKLTAPPSDLPQRTFRLRVSDQKKNVIVDSKTEISVDPGSVKFRLIAASLRPNQLGGNRPPFTRPTEPLRARAEPVGPDVSEPSQPKAREDIKPPRSPRRRAKKPSDKS